MGDALVGQAVGDAGSVADGGDGDRSLGVQHPHGVGLDPLGVGGVEIADAADEIAADVIDVAAAVGGGAHGVENELDLPKADRGVEIPQQGDDLDVEVRGR